MAALDYGKILNRTYICDAANVRYQSQYCI